MITLLLIVSGGVLVGLITWAEFTYRIDSARNVGFNAGWNACARAFERHRKRNKEIKDEDSETSG